MTRETPTEERIEEMLAIEHELAEQYEEYRHQEETTPDESEESSSDEPTDSRLSEHVGRITGFDIERKRWEKSLILSLQTEDGFDYHRLPWPDDPTDETEELVRLCAYLGVPVDRIGDLHGECVPLCKDVEGKTTIHMPPIPTKGNLLRYRAERFLRKKKVLTWYDAVEAAREEYDKKEMKKATSGSDLFDFDPYDPRSVGPSLRREQVLSRWDITAEDIDEDYPYELNSDLKSGVALLVMVAISSIWIVSDPPRAVEVVSMAMTAVIALMVIIILGAVAWIELGRLKDRLFPKVD